MRRLSVLLLSLSCASLADAAYPTINNLADSDVAITTTTMGFCGFIWSGRVIEIRGSNFETTDLRAYLSTSPFIGRSGTLIEQTVSAGYTTTRATITAVTTGLSHGNYRFLILANFTTLEYSTGIPVYVQTTTPAITSVSGDLSHGEQITFTGTNFGTRSDNGGTGNFLAFRYDDFNDATKNDTTLVENPYGYSSWNYTPASNYVYASTSPRTAITNDGHYQMNGEPNNLNMLRVTIGSGRNEVYSSYWVYLNITTGGTFGGLKFSRLISGTSPSHGPNIYNAMQSNGSATFLMETYQSGGDGDIGGVGTDTDCNAFPSLIQPQYYRQWFFVENYYRRSSCDNCHDGEQWTRVNNRLTHDYWKITNRDDITQCAAQNDKGEFDTDTSTSLTGAMNFGVHHATNWNTGESAKSDESYVDFTPARVVVGTAPIFTDCAQFEVQPPISWSDTSITVQGNVGALDDLTGKYAYVVDSYGFTNVNGYEIGSEPPDPGGGGGGSGGAPSVEGGTIQWFMN